MWHVWGGKCRFGGTWKVGSRILLLDGLKFFHPLFASRIIIADEDVRGRGRGLQDRGRSGKSASEGTLECSAETHGVHGESLRALLLDAFQDIRTSACTRSDPAASPSTNYQALVLELEAALALVVLLDAEQARKVGEDEEAFSRRLGERVERLDDRGRGRNEDGCAEDDLLVGQKRDGPGRGEWMHTLSAIADGGMEVTEEALLLRLARGALPGTADSPVLIGRRRDDRRVGVCSDGRVRTSRVTAADAGVDRSRSTFA